MRTILYTIQAFAIYCLLFYFKISCTKYGYDNNVNERIFQYALAFLFLAIPHFVKKEPSKNHKIPIKRFLLGWGVIALGIFAFIIYVTSQVWIAYGTPFEETLFEATGMSMFIVLWGINLLTSTPEVTPTWKRFLRIVCYLFSCFMYSGYEASPLICLSIMFVLMIVEICLNVNNSTDVSIKNATTKELEKYDELEERVEVNL